MRSVSALCLPLPTGWLRHARQGWLALGLGLYGSRAGILQGRRALLRALLCVPPLCSTGNWERCTYALHQVAHATLPGEGSLDTHIIRREYASHTECPLEKRCQS